MKRVLDQEELEVTSMRIYPTRMKRKMNQKLKSIKMVMLI